MTRLKNAVRKFAADESGATMVEYAIMVALIAVVCIVAVQAVGTNTSATFNGVAGQLTPP